MDIVIEQVEAFTVMGLTYRFTDPSGGGDAGKGLLNDFAEEAEYYGINTDTTYAVTVEPSRVAGARNWPPAKPSFYFTYGVAAADEHMASAPFVFCLRRIPAGKYARVTVTDAEIGAAHQAFNPANWAGDGPKPNWALSFQRSPSRFSNAEGEPPKQDFYVSLGSSHDFVLKSHLSVDKILLCVDWRRCARGVSVFVPPAKVDGVQ
jgi:hypothetical protein